MSECCSHKEYLRSQDVESNKPSGDGSFARAPTSFRDLVTSDGSSKFKAEPGRYHLYVSYACPWAHRTLIVRAMKGLEDVIDVSVVHWFNEQLTGWTFNEGEGVIPDTVNGAKNIPELYHKVEPNFQGRYTVPMLWDKKTGTIVNNESAEIIRMLNYEFNEFAKNKDLDLFPEDLRPSIEEVNSWVYPTINDGVYRCGFAKNQEAYDSAVEKLFSGLDKAESVLSKQRYMAGDRFTEADIRIFTTLIRFDIVYFTHFKANIRRITEYPNLKNYLIELFSIPQLRDTTNFMHIKKHYYMSHDSINPRRIVPAGPSQDWLYDAHKRDVFPGKPIVGVEKRYQPSKISTTGSGPKSASGGANITNS